VDLVSVLKGLSIVLRVGVPGLSFIIYLLYSNGIDQVH